MQSRWSGQCPQCGEWNSLEEKEPPLKNHTIVQEKPLLLHTIETQDAERFETGLSELDRLMGGGIVQGSLILLGGDPGIGKSTLMLQIAQAYSKKGLRVLYISGEESKEQAAMRARRLKLHTESLYLFSETLFSRIEEAIDEVEPHLLIIDSVQIVYKGELPSIPGSVQQVREIAIEAMRIAKRKGITTFLIGHVTKSGDLAGPRVLEHIVDTVLDFDGDRDHGYRILRSSKNRFGPTEEIALFQMGAEGLVEVKDPSKFFLQERSQQEPGSVVLATIEGSRALLVEVQALVASSTFPSPARRSTGVDPNRIALLVAVLEKRMGYALHSSDLFLSVAGGLRIAEPGADLALLLAVASSFAHRQVDPHAIVFGEVGLTGEVRSVSRAESRLKEAIHMGFQKALLPKKQMESLPHSLRDQIQLFGIERVEDALGTVLSRKERGHKMSPSP